MSLLAEVERTLARRGIDHAVIGATALAAHGVLRATGDLDLLVLDPTCLTEPVWEELRSYGAEVEIRRGDAADPLAGVVRVAAKSEATIDVIVGRSRWQRDLLHRATPAPIGDISIPVVQAADLVLLKLYAGGPRDAWDIDQLLEAVPSIAAEVESRLSELPRECKALWQRIRDQDASA